MDFVTISDFKSKLREFIVSRPVYAFVRSNILSVLAAVLIVCWFAPVLSSHFADADSYYAHVSVMPQFEHISFAQAYSRVSAAYSRDAGGWFPVRTLPLAVWLIDSHFRIAKFLQYLFIAATLLTFGLLATRLFRSSNTAALAVTSCLACWQFRTPHDPVVGTSLLTTWGALLFFCGWYAWLRRVDSGNKFELVAALGLLCAAMLSGPIPCALVVLLAITSLACRLPGASWLIGTALITTTAIFRLGAPTAPWAHQGSYALNVFNQLLSALPLAYRALNHLAIGHVPNLYHGVRYIDDRFIFIPGPSHLAWLTILLATGLAYSAVSRLSSDNKAGGAAFAWVAGLALWIAPAILLGSAALWRQGLPPGQSFDGVYYQYFGVGLLATAAVRHLCRNTAAASRTAALVSLAVFVACYGNVRANAWVLAKTTAADYNRSVIERAGSAGFFDVFPDGTTFAVSPTFIVPSIALAGVSSLKYLFFHYSHRRFNIVSVARLSKADVGRDWIVETEPSRDNGLILSASHLAAFRGALPLTNRSHGYTPFSYVVDEAAVPRNGVRTIVHRLKDGWTIFAQRTCGAVPIAEAFAASSPTLVYGAGFYHHGPVGYAVPPIQKQALGDVSTDPNMYPKMFMSRHGELRLYKTPCQDQFLNLQAVVVSARPALLGIVTPYGVELFHVTPAGRHFWLRFDLRKDPSPIRLHFFTNAPPAPQFDPVIFHYENDKPRDIRIIFEVEGLWEDSW